MLRNNKTIKIYRNNRLNEQRKFQRFEHFMDFEQRYLVRIK